MKNVFRVIVTLALLGGWLLAASALHVVRAPSGIVVIPKDRIGVRETYVDVSKWDLPRVAAHPGVVGRLIQTNHVDKLSHVTKSTSAEDLVHQIQAAVKEGNVSAPATQPVKTVAELK